MDVMRGKRHRPVPAFVSKSDHCADSRDFGDLSGGWIGGGRGDGLHHRSPLSILRHHLLGGAETESTEHDGDGGCEDGGAKTPCLSSSLSNEAT